jgi:hypothetical protein
MQSMYLILFGVVALSSMAYSGSIEGIIGLAFLGKAAIKGAIAAKLILGAKNDRQMAGMMSSWGK